MGEMIQSSFYESRWGQEKLNPAGYATFEPKRGLNRRQGFEYIATRSLSGSEAGRFQALLKSSASSPEVTDADPGQDAGNPSAPENKRFDEVERAA